VSRLPRIPVRTPSARRQRGLSLLELMISITIGAVLMTGLVATFNQSGESRRELEKTGTLIENGRYAVSLIYDDLHHAGFFGYYYDLGDVPSPAPDPCETADVAKLKAAIAMPFQGFAAATLLNRPDVSATTCDDKGLLTNSNLKAGSDILVIRRADTSVFTGNPVDKAIYMQANSRDLNVLVGSASASVPAQSADGVTANLLKYPSKAGNTTVAETRRFRVHVYFVAPCSAGSGANGVCQSGDDTIPTLKRLELGSTKEDDAIASAATVMRIVPLVEGVEYLKIRYGVDNSPTTANAATGLIGDGIPDSYTASPSAADWGGVISAKVHLLVRATEATQEYTDAKTYALDTVSAGPFGDHFRRRVYSTEAVSMNTAGRREVPK
jgi:type IV pilus assembly protein PilW